MKSRLLSLLWSRPSHAVEWAFLIFLGAMALCGLGWLILEGNADTRESFSKFLAVLGGETEMRVRTPEFVAGGLYLTAWVWVAAAILLWLTRGWWLRPLDHDSTRSSTRLLDRHFLIGVGLVILVALGIRWPRMELSLYNDEADVFRTSIVGGYEKGIFYEIDNDNLPRFRPVSWQETVWGNRIGNNHSLHSILARLGHGAWRRAHDAPFRQVFEIPLRLPSLFGGLLSVGAIACLARLLSRSSRAGWIAGLLVALHPWHLRYSTEARGYGLVFGFSSLALLFLLLALERGRWRWWIGFGVAQVLTLWSCLGSLHLLIGINLLAGFLFVFWQWSSRNDPIRRAALPRWLTISVLSGAFLLLAIAPLLPPIKFAIGTNPTFHQGVPMGWVRDTFFYSLVGMPWVGSSPDNPLLLSVSDRLDQPGTWIGLVVAVLLVLVGVLWLLRRGRIPGFFAVSAPVLGVSLQWMASKIGGATLLAWYANYGSVFISLWMGIGLWALVFRGSTDAEESTSNPSRRRWRQLATYGVLALYLAAIYKPLTVYQSHSKQSLKDAVTFVRGGVYPLSEEQQEPLVATWWTHVNFYDPYVRIAYVPETLQAMIERSRKESRPLYYILGARPLAGAEDPRMLERLEESGDFELLKVFLGLENPQFSLWIYRLKPPVES